FNRSIEGLTTGLNVARTATDSAGFSTRSYTLNLTQGAQFGRSDTANLNADYSQYTSSSTTTSQRTEQLATRFQADHRAQNYTLELLANKNVPIGQNGAQSFFGGVEKFRELSLMNYRFQHGPLSKLPANFMLSAGRYSEGTTL